jgi:hypothetical protein
METQYLYKKALRFIWVKSLLILILITSCGYEAEGQKMDDTISIFKGGSYEKSFSTSRVGVAQSVMTTPGGEFHVVIQHRFGDIKSGAYEFFGLDAALMRFGFDYGITDWLSAGIGRSVFEKTYDLELKAAILKQNESNIPLSISYYIAALENTFKYYFPADHDSFGSRLSFANQLIIARNQGIFTLQVSPIWLHSDFEVRTGGKLNIFAIDLDGRIRLGEKIGLIGEYIPILTNESFTKTNPLTIGLDINTGGHQFQLIFSNSQGTNETSILTNTAGSWSHGHVYFGFNLTRVFHPKMN